jgi:structure-specific endonuclease subunit SLX1
MHMPICYGSVISKKVPSSLSHTSEETIIFCHFCRDDVVGGMKCLNPECTVVGHVICFSKCFIKEKGEYVPVEGECPGCLKVYLWGDLVRKFRGCYNSEDVMIRTEAGDDFYGSDSE